MNTTGLANTDFDINDISVLIATGFKGIAGVNVLTERGIPNKPIVVGSWLEFTRNFGGLLPDALDPLICKTALDLGGRLRVNRIVHYTDITNPATEAGVKATGIIDGDPNFATFAAASQGTWANGKLKVTTTVASSGLANKVDIKVELAGYDDLLQTVRDVPEAPTTDEKTALNAVLNLVKLSTFTTKIPVGTITLSSGTLSNSAVVNSDYIGSDVSGLGLRAFDAFNDIVRIAVPAKAVSPIDIALAAYADLREDVIAITRTPLGLTGPQVLEYRNGTVSGDTHAPIDTWRAFMFTGGLRINHPITQSPIEIPEIGAMLGIMATKDNNTREWFSFSGPKRGIIKGVLGVVYNFFTPARKAAADLVDAAGVNVIIEHPNYGVVSWGNSTLQRANTLLKKAEVAELLMALTRTLKPIVEFDTFDVNDIETWKQKYRRIKPVLDALVDDRAIWKYLYEGDQDIDDISEAQVNSPANIDAGAYQAILWIAPKVAQKYQKFIINVTNSSVDFTVADSTNQPTV